MSDYVPIACGDYDILEVICMDRYEVEIDAGTKVLRGFARGLNIVSGAEFLMLETADDETRTVRIDHIRNLRVLSRPARFEDYQFARPGDQPLSQ